MDGVHPFGETRGTKTQLPFDDNRSRPNCPELYDRHTGEAETGSAGEQPDQGIAGAELIADDEKGVVLPTRSFARVRGRPAGGGRSRPRDLVLTLTLVFGFGLKPHRTDRFRPALKNAYWGASVLVGSCKERQWRRR